MSARLLIAFIIAMLGAAMACGGGGDGDQPGNPTTSPPASSPLAADQVRVTYYGHSMFTIESPGGVTLLTDPNEGIGYAAPSGEIDVVTVSHEHFDHNKVEIAPNARVLRGLDGGDWAAIDETVGDVRIRSGRSYHDDQRGDVRGLNAFFVFEIGNTRIVHAGDLGHNPSERAFGDIETLQAFLGLALSADVLLLPVGGHFTIGPPEADEVVESLHPTLVIPMHYRTEFLRDLPDADELATVDDFTAGKRNVLRPRQNTVIVAAGPQEPTAIMVLEPQPE